ncbi:class I adenylate-forming enzyme family protein [Burkholderia multivorans]|jgi:acyl-CoA synthetase|uniref:class I adenylate-forming enzyme family protein n=1 Tax=Burkholderia multivorans TaxID=87883 RepID=UPI00057CF14F|nr:class I adenylate-forming enzyme family protein [Burkholderia multivorans]KHS10019.1 AMP-dependent synthetase [Burkholderia multivorans]KHS14987.1 AMP-dependent synthetase [Burkholderia multivorans]MBR7922973.1 acyl--CoA ligase [Burkholderia multivorans]MBR8103513.1 acyl--CoA ligase [Burkholderia multivorans]MBU9429371.1 acyl--CoA ligase [Burkholderia multivorans]
MQNILTLHNPQNARDYYLSGVWQQETLYTLARRHARERPTSCALRDADVRLTWREVVDWVDSVAEALHRQGLKPGDRVGIWLPNVVHTAIVFLACSRNGYVCCPSLHQNYTVEEIRTLLHRTQCRALFAMPGYGADADRHSIFARVDEIPTLAAVFALPDPLRDRSADLAGALPFPERQPPAAVAPPDLNPDKIVYLAFTSGTTGQPKGVMHSDNTLLANGRALVEDWGHTSDTTLLTLSPMSHHIATVAIEQMLVAGLELVMTNLRGSKHALDWILETGATYVMGVPTHAMDILQAVRDRDLRTLGDVRTFYMAGAAIPREVAQKFLSLGVTPQNVYGMTENGSHNYTIPNDTPDTIVSTCGRACRGYEVRLWKQDDSDVEAEPGEIGEIGGRGGLLMLGYFSNQVATETSFNIHGWFMSGDLGMLDDHGCLVIVGRKKDLIIRGGHNIHPARIEELAMRHPLVERAAAYPVQDQRLGEKVCLSVIVRTGQHLDPHDMLAHLANCGLSKYDMPEYYLPLDAFPLTASGKILKRDLVEMTLRGELKPISVRYKAPVTAGV